MSNEIRAQWDAEAAAFDEAPDHGLRDPMTRDAWRRLLAPLLPSERPQRIADVGCGTGTLSILLAEAGHHVRGVDFASNMLRIAREKAAPVSPTPTFIEGDAAAPPLPDGAFDVVLSRHVLWALADRAVALENWRRLLRPGGRLILIEGNWSTGAGLTAAECADLVQHLGGEYDLRPLPDPALWGGEITDERYLMISEHHPNDEGRH